MAFVSSSRPTAPRCSRRTSVTRWRRSAASGSCPTRSRNASRRRRWPRPSFGTYRKCRPRTAGPPRASWWSAKRPEDRELVGAVRRRFGNEVGAAAVSRRDVRFTHDAWTEQLLEQGELGLARRLRPPGDAIDRAVVLPKPQEPVVADDRLGEVPGFGLQ